MPIRPSTAGIDAGATLCKLVFQAESTLHTESYGSSELERVRSRLADWAPERIVTTGGAGSSFGAFPSVSEFAAWSQGAPLLAERAGLTLPERYLLVSLGTGTSILSIAGTSYHRAGGSALGGGTVVGLGKLLLGATSFEEIAGLAAEGDRRRVDLLVGDIYASGELPLPADINAASFAKLDSREPVDLAHALMGLVGENIALICAGIARETAAESVVYCGSTLCANQTLEEILLGTSAGLGLRGIVLPDGAYCGAVGAAALAEP